MYYIGADLGTSSLKMLLLDEEKNILNTKKVLEEVIDEKYHNYI